MPAEFFLGYDEDGNFDVAVERSDLNDEYEYVQIVAFNVELPRVPLPVVRVKLVQQTQPPHDPIRVEIPATSVLP